MLVLQFAGRFPAEALLGLLSLSCSLIVASTPCAIARGDRDRFPTIQHDRAAGDTEDPVPDGEEPRRPVAERPSSWASEQRSFTSHGPTGRHIAAHVRPLANTVSKDAGSLKSRAVSIYEDRTLRRGDAVMTEAGLRIFSGSTTFPYKASDFTDLGSSHALSKNLRYSLNAYDHQMPLPQIAEEAPVMTVHLAPPIPDAVSNDQNSTMKHEALVDNVSLQVNKH